MRRRIIAVSDPSNWSGWPGAQTHVSGCCSCELKVSGGFWKADFCLFAWDLWCAGGMCSLAFQKSVLDFARSGGAGLVPCTRSTKAIAPPRVWFKIQCPVSPSQPQRSFETSRGCSRVKLGTRPDAVQNRFLSAAWALQRTGVVRRLVGLARAGHTFDF